TTCGLFGREIVRAQSTHFVFQCQQSLLYSILIPVTKRCTQDQPRDKKMEFLKKSVKPAARSTAAHLQRALKSWKVAIIDDERQVHAVTKLVLGNTRIDDIPLEFLSAHNAAEGLRLFKDHPDIALAFIDVVMETDEAGLDLIHKIRNEL